MQKKLFLLFLIFLCAQFQLLAQTIPPTPTPAVTPAASITPTRTTTPGLPIGSWYGTFHVFVYNADSSAKTALSGVLVTLTDQNTSTMVTDINGLCQMTVLLHDTSTLRYTLTAAGYETLSGTAYSVKLPSGIRPNS